MVIAGSMATVWLIVAAGIPVPAHHEDAVTFSSTEPTVARTVNGNLELTMTMTPRVGDAGVPQLGYEMDYRNISRNLIVNLIIQNPIPEHTQFQVGSATAGAPPATIRGVVPLYSSDGGATWGYVPVSGGGGAPVHYDANVTHVRFVMSGSLPPGMASESGVGFVVRIAVQ